MATYWQRRPQALSSPVVSISIVVLWFFLREALRVPFNLSFGICIGCLLTYFFFF